MQPAGGENEPLLSRRLNQHDNFNCGPHYCQHAAVAWFKTTGVLVRTQRESGDLSLSWFIKRPDKRGVCVCVFHSALSGILGWMNVGEEDTRLI